MLILLLAVIYVATSGISDARASGEDLLREKMPVALDLLRLKGDLSELRVNLLTVMADENAQRREKGAEAISQLSQQIDETMQRLQAKGEGDPALTGGLAELENVLEDIRDTRTGSFVPLILAGKAAEALALVVGVQQEHHAKIRKIVDELGERKSREALDLVQASGRRAEQALLVFTLAGIVALGMGLMLPLYLNRAIAAPLKEVSDAAARIAGGDLTLTLSGDSRRDEVGRLTQAFAVMTGSLKKQTEELMEGISVLMTASTQIVAAVSQLTSSATETATAVSQTTTTVEEVKQTAHVASEKSRAVFDTSQRAVEGSSAGEQAVEEAVDGMQQIQRQMEAIGESIVQLSEQCQAIGEIIATVDDLAEQSNLLSVNASIEAARAGEAGKGFTVVAQEIKAMAEQSKQATAQVRAILNDIQKATGTAVMATEQGSKVVAAGVQQAAKSKESIQMLAQSVRASAQAATQIATSSRQQLVGMDQVASAMESIKQATEQNMETAKQVETAARNLHELGQRLKGLAEGYRV